MTLADECAKLKTVIATLAEQRANANVVEGLGTRLGQVAVPRGRLIELCDVRKTLDECGAQVQLPTADIAALAAQIREVAVASEADPTVISKGSAANKRAVWDQLVGLPIQIEESLRSAWARWVEESIGTANRPVVEVLGRLPDRTKTWQELTAIYDSVRPLANSLPSKQTIDTVKERAASAADLFGKLGGKDLPTPVFRFLEAATGSGAALSDMNSDIQKWLEEHRLLGKLKLRF